MPRLQLITAIDPSMPILLRLVRLIVNISSTKLCKGYRQHSLVPPDVHLHLVFAVFLCRHTDDLHLVADAQW
jgi:hypothetical protein